MNGRSTSRGPPGPDLGDDADLVVIAGQAGRVLDGSVTVRLDGAAGYGQLPLGFRDIEMLPGGVHAGEVDVSRPLEPLPLDTYAIDHLEEFVACVGPEVAHDHAAKAMDRRIDVDAHFWRDSRRMTTVALIVVRADRAWC